ncbi:hypothetical protein Ancab_029203, partial [Ancistrocladus abbreviatus]
MRTGASNSWAAAGAVAVLALCLLNITASARPHIATARRSLLNDGVGRTPPRGGTAGIIFIAKLMRLSFNKL